MQLSVGVVLILDQAATPFTRIWCCFEESIAAAQLRILEYFGFWSVSENSELFKNHSNRSQTRMVSPGLVKLSWNSLMGSIA